MYMQEVIHFFADDPHLLKECLKIRKKVFNEEQGISMELECDDHTVGAEYLLIKQDGIPVATCRWRNTEKGIKLERFAVLKACRKLGLGTALIRKSLQYILPCNDMIYVHSQETAVRFYEKNHFTIKGESFMEAEIKHFYMEYEESSYSAQGFRPMK